MDLVDHLHPYLDANMSSSFKYDYSITSTNSLRVSFLNTSVNDKSIKTLNTLNLPMIYHGHSEKELKDLYDLRYKYSDNYLQILLDKTFQNLPISENEKYKLIFGIELDEKDYHKRIMSKFKKDIIEKLLEIK